MVKITYIGGAAAIEVDTREERDDEERWVEVSRGDSVDVPDFLAFGAPAVPGVQIVDGEEVPYEWGAAPIGEITIPPLPHTTGYLDQPDNWVRAKGASTPRAKGAGAAESSTPDTTTPEDGD